MWTIETSSLGRIAVPPQVPEGFAVFVTTRDFQGKITPEIAETIRGAVRERFGIDAVLRTCTQVHGIGVERVKAGREWRECDSCDALWSDAREVALGIKVADCLPITMVDPTHCVVGNVHSGWRGAARKITATAVDRLAASSAFDPSTAYAYLGPSIRACCFEVGEEVASQFHERFVLRNGSKPHVDLVAFTTAELLARGFEPSRISDSGLCTRCEGSIFHSYRRDGAGNGRNLAIVAQ